MSDERIVLSKDQALSMLGDGDDIHTFRTPGMGIMLGSDWKRQSILDAIEDNECELGGPMCQRMNHGLIIHIDGPLFVECSNDFDYAAFELALTAPQETKAAGDE